MNHLFIYQLWLQNCLKCGGMGDVLCYLTFVFCWVIILYLALHWVKFHPAFKNFDMFLLQECTNVFSKGGGESLAAQASVPFLGKKWLRSEKWLKNVTGSFYGQVNGDRIILTVQIFTLFTYSQINGSFHFCDFFLRRLHSLGSSTHSQSWTRRFVHRQVS